MIQSGAIPYLPASAQITQQMFGALPLLNQNYYIPGALLAGAPATINLDPSTGAQPSLVVGLIFAISPCTQEYHFGVQVGSGQSFWPLRRPGLCEPVLVRALKTLDLPPHTPAPPTRPRAHHAFDAPNTLQGVSIPVVELPELDLEITAQPLGLSYSGTATLSSTNPAINMPSNLWVGPDTSTTETRVLSDGNIFLSGSVTLQPMTSSPNNNAAGISIAVVGTGNVRFAAGCCPFIIVPETSALLTDPAPPFACSSSCLGPMDGRRCFLGLPCLS